MNRIFGVRPNVANIQMVQMLQVFQVVQNCANWCKVVQKYAKNRNIV